MNLILLEPGEIEGGPGARARAVLTGRRARHVRRVLDAAPGDRVRVGVIRGARGTAEIASIRAISGDDDDAEVELAVALTEPACARPRVDLVLALPRPKALGRALQTAAALGVGRIDLVNAWRVDKSYFQAARLAPDALRAELLAGCEQGATTWLPDIAVHRLLMPFLDRELAARSGPAVILHPRAAARLEDAVPPGARSRVIVAIGPERGWIDRELATFTDRGFAPVSLGDRVLKVDTAVTAALAQLALLSRLSGNRT